MLPFVIAVLIGYLFPAVAFFFGQGTLIFPAPTVDRVELDASARTVGATVTEITTADGVKLYGWHRTADRPEDAPKTALIYFHGNAETVDGRLDLHELALENGIDVVVFAYRGYPGSEGRPSEYGLHADARAVWAYVMGLGIAPDRVVIHGKSLGGGVAAALAAEVHPRALVLESTFTSVRSIATRALPIYPVGLLIRHPFDTDQIVTKVDAPILILHGNADDVIPVEHGRALAKLLPQARYVEVPSAGHHETLPVRSPEARGAWLSLFKDKESEAVTTP